MSMIPNKSSPTQTDVEDRILWICPPYGIQYTNFNLTDLDVYPGEVMKTFSYGSRKNQAAFLKKSIEVTEKGLGSVHIKSSLADAQVDGIDINSLRLNCVL